MLHEQESSILAETGTQGSYRIAVFGGCYNNSLALQATIDDARRRGAQAIYCLGDMGGFGPHPDRVFPLLWENEVICMQGNYDHSIGNRLADCACGYIDPRDNYYAQISYEYTLANTSDRYKDWLRELPPGIGLELAHRGILMVHGSPRRVNEFLWESTTPEPFLAKLFNDCHADMILCTHTGIHWQRQLPDERRIVNIGAIGRPPDDGQTTVWYALLTIDPGHSRVESELLPVAYDYERLAYEMRQERLPEEFVKTILTGSRLAKMGKDACPIPACTRDSASCHRHRHRDAGFWPSSPGSVVRATEPIAHRVYTGRRWSGYKRERNDVHKRVALMAHR